MIVAVNTVNTSNKESEENDHFIFEVFGRIIKLHPAHNFILISEKKLDEVLTSLKNVINIEAGTLKKNPLSWYLWYNVKIPAILKKYNADIFISCTGIASLTSRIPQYIIDPDLTFLHQRGSFKKSDLLFYKNVIPRSIKKATTIITSSKFYKSTIIKKYKTNADKIKVVYRNTDENFGAISFEEREKLKTTYADGNEYFVYTGNISVNENLLNLLKAFSAFKKRQKSSMQLLIAGKQGWKYKDFLEQLGLFKFKEDVKIVEGPSSQELVKIIAAAYAMVNPSLYEITGMLALAALKSSVPVITSANSAMAEICADAALYADAENFKEIAVKMMQLFKDENLRKELIEKGKIRIQHFNWNITSNMLWEIFESNL